MSYQIVNVNGCKREFVAEVPAEEIEALCEELARKLARSAKVPGFRPGKVPMTVIRQRYGSEIRSDAVQDLIQKKWKEAIGEHGLEPLGQPSVRDLQDQPGAPLKFKLAFEVRPAIEPKDYRGLAGVQENPAVEEAAVEKSLEHLRERHAQYVPVEGGGAANGHFLTVTLDGAFEPGGKPLHEDEVVIELGSPETHQSFTDNLLGSQPGETRDFAVTYPAEFHRKRFAGKTVRYSITVKEIKEKQLPELNPDFAKDLGLESVEGLRARVQEELLREARLNAEKKARESIVDQALERNPFDVPDAMVEEELRGYVGRLASSFGRQGLDPRKLSLDWDKLLEEHRPEAIRSVRRSLLLDAVANQEGIVLTEDELEEEIRKAASATGKTQAVLRAQLEKDQRIQDFRAHLVRQKALDFMIRDANIARG